MKKVADIGELEAIIDCEELRPYISPSYYETQSRESMIVRKMRNNIMKSIPKKWDNPVQAYEYNTMDATYRKYRKRSNRMPIKRNSFQNQWQSKNRQNSQQLQKPYSQLRRNQFRQQVKNQRFQIL